MAPNHCYGFVSIPPQLTNRVCAGFAAPDVRFSERNLVRRFRTLLVCNAVAVGVVASGVAAAAPDDGDGPVDTTSVTTEALTDPHDVITFRDRALLSGKRRVVVTGMDGRGERIVETTTIGGVTLTEIRSSTVLLYPVAEVVVVGARRPTRPDPAPEPVPVPAPAPEPVAESEPVAEPESEPVAEPEPAASSAYEAVWDQLAECESGGDWSINTGNGYYGGLQFAAETWSGLGGAGLPHENSKDEQIRLATILRDQSDGYGAWPSCAAQLGLPT